MDFSIVIPVQNEAAHLLECLQALSRLDYPRDQYEIIVVDNGSTDGSAKIVEGWPNVQLLHEPKGDAYAARNLGITTAQGKIIAFTDGDCTVSENWLTCIKQAFDDEGADVMIGRLAYGPGSSSWLRLYEDYYNSKTRWIFRQPLSECFYGHGGNMAILAEIFQKLGPFREAPIVGDTEILHRLLAHENDWVIRYSDDAVVIHREVEHLFDLLPKLGRYGQYSLAVSEVSNFRTLTLCERFKIFRVCVQDHHYGWGQRVRLLLVLATGLFSFELGRNTARRSSSSDSREAPTKPRNA
jgi:glycosyltransferase involved in cell wall biosynthesis